MMFTLSPEQTDFAAVLHGFLAAGKTDLASLGVDEVTDPVDLVVVFEELGHHAVSGPLIESLAVLPFLGVGPGSVAFPPDVPRAVEADRYFLVEGDTLREAAPTAQLTSVDPPHRLAEQPTTAAPHHLAELSSVDPTLRLAELSSVDPTRRLVELTAGATIATGVPSAQAFDLGVLTCSAQLLGLGCALLEMTTAHARARTQFGKPIGQFQAVKHHLANVLIGLELARPLVFGAAVTMTTRDISAAKVATSDAAWQAARTALQVHGAIGYTAEHPLGRFLLQTRALRSAWGSPSMHRARVLEAL